jgi:hypothetical protein
VPNGEDYDGGTHRTVGPAFALCRVSCIMGLVPAALPQRRCGRGVVAAGRGQSRVCERALA